MDTIFLLALVAIPYCYVLARVASIAYFHAKLNYHIHILSATKEEMTNGKCTRA